jgi:hypothetical protein
MGGMPYGLAGPTPQTNLGRATPPFEAAQAEPPAVSERWPNDAVAAPTETCEVSSQLTEQARRFTKLIIHRVPITEVHDAFQLALSPGAAKNAVVTFGD